MRFGRGGGWWLVSEQNSSTLPPPTRLRSRRESLRSPDAPLPPTKKQQAGRSGAARRSALKSLAACEKDSRGFEAGGFGWRHSSESGAMRPHAPHRSPRQAFGGRQKLTLTRGRIRENPLAHSLYSWLSIRKGRIWVAFKSAVKMQ
jgi:hypothetical protein